MEFMHVLKKILRERQSGEIEIVYEATRRIKSCLPATRVIILSVHAGPEEQENAQATGADVFIAKDASYEILINAILGENDCLNRANSLVDLHG
jgi:CheY-like chemotaxis protein